MIRNSPECEQRLPAVLPLEILRPWELSNLHLSINYWGCLTGVCRAWGRDAGERVSAERRLVLMEKMSQAAPRTAQLPPRTTPAACKALACCGSSAGNISTSQSHALHTHKHVRTERDALEDEICLELMTNSIISQPTKAGSLLRPSTA